MGESARAGRFWGAVGLRPGIGYMAAAALAFSVMTLCVKQAGETLPSIVIVAARQLFSLGASALLVRRAGLSLVGRRRGLLMARAVFGTSGLICFFYALTKLPLAEATVIQFTGPIWAAIMAALVLREPAHRYLPASIGLSVAGVVVIAKPSVLFGDSGATLNAVAVAVAFLGTLFSAAAYIAVRELRKSDAPPVIIFYLAWFSCLVVVPWAATTGQLPVGVEWWWLLGVGVTAQLAQEWLTRGLALEPTGPALATSYVQVVLAVLWGWLFFAEVPGVWTIAGVGLVAVGTGLVMLFSANGDGRHR